MTEQAFDPVAMLRLLARHHVDFVLVGGYAATLHGATRNGDLDLTWRACTLGPERQAVTR